MVTLGSDKGEGFITSVGAVVRDSLGRYWVPQVNDGIKVFGADGTYERMYGRSGRGPGEFRNPYVMIARHDTIHIFDTQNVRHTVVDADFTILEESRLADRVHSAAILDSGGLALNIPSRLPKLIGLPMHLVPLMGGEIIRSFGSDSAEYFNARASWPGWRFLAPGGGTTVWVAHRSAYRLEQWDTVRGRKVREIVREVDWFEPYDRQLPLSTDRLPSPYIATIQRDTEGRIWVFVQVGDPDWANHLLPYKLPDGRDLPQPESYDSVYDTIVEVFDPTTGRLLATQRVPMAVIGKANEDMVISGVVSPNAGFQLRVWHTALIQP